MKKTHIIGILVIAVAIIVIISTAGDASAYVTFKEAKEMYDHGNKNKIHVVGTLKKAENGDILGIQTSPDMLSFKFTMLDENNFEQEVFHPNPMPTDFLRSEQVVVVGSYENGKFIADKILLKCPSKYQEEGVNV
ncbi:cytochrome c maturation protein CcmE [Marinoscillum sp. MHG1-6]|uniref:cytochrome c maturation protein CcmE n=1 Tax=Marinoscillum sp. MHG1-6 TaxID=2959627 RepID=UPI002157017E|nr:cytochrome c maturation protein CcmE [Marinoscillum sp. MHG1-6]